MLPADRLHPSPRSGLTLVEMLVVIAIIGTLVALLLPAGKRRQDGLQLAGDDPAIHRAAEDL